MALDTQGQLSFSYEDGLGTKASQVIYVQLDSTKTIANLKADAQAMAALLVAITDVKMLSVDAAVVLVPSADQTGKPISTSRVEQTGVFNFLNASNPRRFGEAVPGLSDDVISGGTIDLGAPVADFVAAMHTISATGATQPTTNYFVLNTGLADAFLSFRKRRKSLERSSFEI